MTGIATATGGRARGVISGWGYGRDTGYSDRDRWESGRMNQGSYDDYDRRYAFDRGWDRSRRGNDYDYDRDRGGWNDDWDRGRNRW